MPFTRTFTVDFSDAAGTDFSVGYTLYNPDGSEYAARVTTGVNEVGSGTKIYEITAEFTSGWYGEIRFDTGTDFPEYHSDDVNEDESAQIQFKVVNFGSARGGSTTIGYAVYSGGTTIVARTTSGIAELGTTTGSYGATIDFGGAVDGSLLWDTGGESPVYASEAVNIVVAAAPAAGTSGILDGLYNLETPGGPSSGQGYADVMAAVVAALAADPDVVAQFGHSSTTPKFMADEAAGSPALPYAVYTEPDETPMRVFGGTAIGNGSFELGVFDTTKQGARLKLDLVRRAINGIELPTPLVDGQLTWIKSEAHRSREIVNTAPTAPTDPTSTEPPAPVSIEFGRAQVFRYRVVRNDP